MQIIAWILKFQISMCKECILASSTLKLALWPWHADVKMPLTDKCRSAGGGTILARGSGAVF